MTRSTLSMKVAGTRTRLKSDMRIYGINPEMATDRQRWCHGQKRRHYPDGRRRKRLVFILSSFFVNQTEHLHRLDFTAL